MNRDSKSKWTICQRFRRIFVTRNNVSRSPKSNLQLSRFDTLKTDVENPEVSDPNVSLVNNFNPATDSFHASIRPIILLANCFSILPVSGVNSPDASYLKFTWYSPKLLYTIVFFLSTTVMTVLNALQFTTGINSMKMTTGLVFYGTSLIASLLFLKLAKLWPCLALTWEKVEREFMFRHRRISRISLAGRFKLTTAIVMILALVEHSLSILKGSFYAMTCAKYRSDSDVIAEYFESQYTQVFSQMSYSLWKAILVEIVNLLSTFSWNFVDLFLILVSMALADQFQQLNSRLNSVRGKAMPEWWWAEARNDYNHLAGLTRRVDSHISTIVFLSFATDLYFICIQLLFSFNLQRNHIQKIYFCFSFGFLLTRTTAVSLYAASVNDESRLPAPILYSVSSASYSTEVMRFLTQVTTDNISLTGMKFFSVTRGLVLTIAGTIVTYELVLVQINNIQQTVQSNITNICEVDEEQLYNNGSTVLL
ncbi:gustatory receptor 5a for trehalose-like isoform X2 [Vespa crabro]|uniref:gustatory receptor 5a for trehalose-like isoform X2 n=1 Tax=Vespa crabro TaxID=7445 RepID=UPI001F00F5AC|nr:gustatory receptor 5a for trehalose-like isoform X2 [Vespa crabro]